MAKPLPADLQARLRKLIPLLGSDQPGEVQATVEAIKRALTGAGCDWHDLTAAITHTGNLPATKSSYNGPTRRYEWDHPTPKNHTKTREYNDDGYVSRPKDDVLREVGIILSSGMRLGISELQFINDMTFRAKKYSKVGFTSKQKTWWNNIFTRACNHAAQAANTP